MSQTIIRNRKAFHEFEVLDTFEAGIVLKGTEVKSVRQGHVHIADAFCVIDDRLNLDLHNAKINVYSHGNRHNHDPDRKRRLLMHRREITKLREKIREKGLTLIPLSMYFKKDYLKVSLGLCKGKKLYDKREDLKKKDAKKEENRVKKEFRA